MNLLQLAKASMARLAPRGKWTQGRHRTPTGAVCMVGAIDAVLERKSEVHPMGAKLIKLLAEEIGPPTITAAQWWRHDLNTVMSFNDKTKTNKKNVLAVYQRVIDKLQARRAKRTVKNLLKLAQSGAAEEMAELNKAKVS